MDSKKLNDWLQVTGLFSVVAGLVFVGLQLALDRDVAEAERAREDTAGAQYWAELLTNNTDVWIKGLAGEPLSAKEAAQFNVLATARLRLFANSINQGRLGLAIDPQFPAALAAQLIYENPGLERWWSEYNSRVDAARERAELGPSVWRTMLNEELDYLRKQSRGD